MNTQTRKEVEKLIDKLTYLRCRKHTGKKEDAVYFDCINLLRKATNDYDQVVGYYTSNPKDCQIAFDGKPPTTVSI